VFGLHRERNLENLRTLKAAAENPKWTKPDRLTTLMPSFWDAAEASEACLCTKKRPEFSLTYQNVAASALFQFNAPSQELR